MADSTSSDERKNFHVPSRGAVDDRNTVDGQLIGVRISGSHQRLQSSRRVQMKKYLPGMKNFL